MSFLLFWAHLVLLGCLFCSTHEPSNSIVPIELLWFKDITLLCSYILYVHIWTRWKCTFMLEKFLLIKNVCRFLVLERTRRQKKNNFSWLALLVTRSVNAVQFKRRKILTMDKISFKNVYVSFSLFVWLLSCFVSLFYLHEFLKS